MEFLENVEHLLSFSRIIFLAIFKNFICFKFFCIFSHFNFLKFFLLTTRGRWFYLFKSAKSICKDAWAKYCFFLLKKNFGRVVKIVRWISLMVFFRYFKMNLFRRIFVGYKSLNALLAPNTISSCFLRLFSDTKSIKFVLLLADFKLSYIFPACYIGLWLCTIFYAQFCWGVNLVSH